LYFVILFGGFVKQLSNSTKYWISFAFFNIINFVLVDSAPERVENPFLSIGFVVVFLVILYAQAAIQAHLYCEENGKLVKDGRYDGYSVAFLIINCICAILLTLISIVT
jgi:hypothetical protein